MKRPVVPIKFYHCLLFFRLKIEVDKGSTEKSQEDNNTIDNFSELIKPKKIIRKRIPKVLSQVKNDVQKNLTKLQNEYKTKDITIFPTNKNDRI